MTTPGRGSRGIVEVSDYLSVPRKNKVILGWSVLCFTTFFSEFLVILAFQFTAEYRLSKVKIRAYVTEMSLDLEYAR